jgi:hypothetical protein
MSAHIELPVMLSELRRASTPSIGGGQASRHSLERQLSAGPSKVDELHVPPSPSAQQDDLERITRASVIGREAGERDPLLLRDRIVSEQAISGLKR